MIKKEKISKNNVVKFPSKSTDIEKEIEGVIFAAAEPSEKAHREEITNKTSIVREIHVFGKAISIGEREEFSFQHQGIGKKLMMEAEKIAATDLSSERLCVISAVGTREYYRKLGYKINGPYMAKRL